MIRQRTYYDQLLLVIMEKIDTEKVFRIIADSQMLIQITVLLFPLDVSKVLDPVL